jgi:hypothetical protein
MIEWVLWFHSISSDIIIITKIIMKRMVDVCFIIENCGIIIRRRRRRTHFNKWRNKKVCCRLFIIYKKINTHTLVLEKNIRLWKSINQQQYSELDDEWGTQIHARNRNKYIGNIDLIQIDTFCVQICLWVTTRIDTRWWWWHQLNSYSISFSISTNVSHTID